MNLRSFLCRALLLALAVLSLDALAQNAVPSADEMIQQLKTPRTRSLRNLVIQADPVAGAASAPGATNAGASSGTVASSTTPPEPVAPPSLSLNIQFDFNSSRVRPESIAALGNLATALSSPALAKSRFSIEGHTDAKGNADYNRKLSAQRAQSVKDLLVAKGIDADRLASQGKGSSEPANPADPLAAENRRVRVVNLD